MSNTPQWQPTSRLPMLAQLVDGMLEDAERQLKNIREAVEKPHLLDDATVERLILLYSEQSAYVPIYAEQFKRWMSEPLSAPERSEVERLIGKLPALRSAIAEILELAQRVEPQTIDEVMGIDDPELGLQALVGKIKLPEK